jgi:hypothetical protein
VGDRRLECWARRPVDRVRRVAMDYAVPHADVVCMRIELCGIEVRVRIREVGRSPSSSPPRKSRCLAPPLGAATTCHASRTARPDRPARPGRGAVVIEQAAEARR